MKVKKDEGYCKGYAKLYRECAGFYAYQNPECYIKKKQGHILMPILLNLKEI